GLLLARRGDPGVPLGQPVPQGARARCQGDPGMTDTRDPSAATPAPLRFPPRVRQAVAYQPDWAGQDREGLIRLDRNEATGPLSSAVAEALTAHIQRYGVHGYPEYPKLAAALGAYCGVSAESILPTNGSDQAIDLCAR